MLQIQSMSNKKFKKITAFIFLILVFILLGAAGIGHAFHSQQKTQSTKILPKILAFKKPAEPNKATTIQSTPHAAALHDSSTPASAASPATIRSATTQCTGNTVGKLLLVSISLQHLWVCETGTLVNQSTATTGMTQAPNNVDDATPTGSWQIYSKQTNQRLRGSDVNGSWDDFVQYWIPFDGAIGFHDASWQTFPFGSSDYKIGGSHGCIHLPLNVITWVYDWAPIGTTVTVVE